MSQRSYWWEDLKRGGTSIPLNVVERLGWYEREVSRQRMGFLVLDILIIAVSASIPSATVMGASAGIAGILGALVTGLVSLRQLFRSAENWVRFSATLVAMQAELVSWAYSRKPYDDAQAEGTLAHQVEALVLRETMQWTALRTSNGSNESAAKSGTARSTPGS